MKTLFLSREIKSYSRSSFLYESYQGEKEFKHLYGSISEIRRQLELISSQMNDEIQAIVLMSPNHMLSRIIKKNFKQVLILDAGWPLSDANFTRSINPKTFVNAAKNLAIDYIAFHSADKIIFESKAQKNRSSMKFKLRANKSFVIYTGCSIDFENSIQVTHTQARKQSVVYFRGKYNRESGLENIIEAASLLNDSFKFIISTNKKFKVLPSNVEVDNRHLSNTQIIDNYSNSDIVLGQLSNHPRIQYSIPHKFFEAAALGKAYITAESQSLREIVDDSMVHFIKNVSPEEIAREIVILNEDIAKRATLEANIRKLFCSDLSAKALNSRFQSLLTQFKDE